MKVRFYPPQPEIDWLVKKYEMLIDGSGTHHKDRHLPRGDSAIVVNIEESAFSLAEDNTMLPSGFITTIRPKSVILENGGKIKSFIAICKTSVLSRLLGLDMHLYKDAPFIDLESTALQGLKNKLVSQANPLDIQHFPAFLQVAGLKYSGLDEVDEAYNFIIEKAAFCTFDEIRHMLNMHERMLRRRFAQRVGVSPKTLARIVRVYHVFNRIIQEEKCDFMEIICECQYCDQSHFIKDFKSIVGETPYQFFRRKHDKVKFLSGQE